MLILWSKMEQIEYASTGFRFKILMPIGPQHLWNVFMLAAKLQRQTTCYTQAPYQASAPHLKPFANDGRLLLGALRTPLEICRILKRETNHGHNGHISLHIPTLLFFNSHLPCFIDMRMGQNLGFMPESWGVGGMSIHGSTDPRTPSIFIQIYFIILCLLYVRIHIYILYVHMVVSWNGATPIAGWFIVELPSIHGWELG